MYLKPFQIEIIKFILQNIQMEYAQDIKKEESLKNYPSNQSSRSLLKQSKQISFTYLFRFSTSFDLLLMTIGFISSVFMGTAIPLFAFITGNMIDSFVSKTSIFDVAKDNLFLYIYLGLGTGFVAMAMFSTWMLVGQRQTIACRKIYFKQLIKQELGWFDTQKQTQICNNFSLDCLSFQLVVGEKISTLLMLISMLISGVIISLYLGWILALVYLGYIPIILYFWYKDVVIKENKSKSYDSIYQEASGKILEALSSVRLVKQMNAQDFQISRCKQILRMATQKQMHHSYLLTLVSFISILTLNLGFALIYWYGSQCVFGTEKCPPHLNPNPYTAGVVVKILYSLLLPAISLNQLTPCLQKIAQGRAATARIFAIIDRQPLVKSIKNALKPTQFSGNFKFINVSFAYPKDKSLKILQNLNLEIDCKNSAIVGESGCGKSTIFQLMMRFYDPDEGIILLDDINIKQLDLNWLRSCIGSVQQQPVLFATSLRENLLLGKEDATDEQIFEALRKAEAFDFVQQLKEGLNTYVGSGGSQLSGGQKQRVAIARALLKNPKMLLLDEATSALDHRNEKEILGTLNRIGKELTVVNITHRRRVLIDCDKVHYFKNRKIERMEVNSVSQISGVIRIDSAEKDDSNEEDLKVQGDQNQCNETTEIIKQGVNSMTCLKVNQLSAHKIQNQKKPNKVLETSKQMTKNSKIGNVFAYLYDSKCLFVAGFLLALTQGLAFPLLGVILGQVVSAMLHYPEDPSYYKNRVHICCYIIVGLAFLTSMAKSLMHFCFSKLSAETIKKIRIQSFSKIIKMPIPWFEKHQNQPQKLTAMLSSSCKTLNNFIQSFIGHVTIVIANILFAVVASLAFDWRTGLTSLGLIPMILLAQTIQFKFINGYNESKGKIFQQSLQTVSESIMNIRTVLSLGGAHIIENRYKSQLSKIFKSISKKCLIAGFMYGVSYFLQFISFGLIFFFAAVFIDNYDIQIQKCISTIFLLFFACTSAGANANYLGDLSNAKSAANKIFSIFQLQDQFQISKKQNLKQLTDQIKGDIEFKNVSFKYQSRQHIILDNVSFRIKAGEKVGLVGHSGCGKSTIMSLLLRFYKPIQGHILIDGIDIKDFNLHHLRACFGVVSQEPVLFNQSISQNIRYNKDTATDSEIEQAAIRANFNPYKETVQSETFQRSQKLISNNLTSQKQMYSGLMISQEAIERKSSQKQSALDKVVGPKGSHISGGQKQRIAIARAIIRNPTVLLLDEATSALDPENEAMVQSSLDQLMKNKTALNITHRMQTIQNSNLIIVIHKGRMVECGAYNQLVERKGYFFKILHGMQIQ